MTLLSSSPAAHGVAAHAGNKPRLLYVCPRMPYPPDSGGSVRILNLVKYLHRDVSVDMLCFGQESPSPERMQALSQLCGQSWFVQVPSRTVLRLARALARSVLGGVPLLAALDHHRQVAAALKTVLAKNHYDVVYYDYLHTGPYLLSQGAGPLTVTGFHNLESEIWHRKAHHKGALTRWFWAWQARQVSRYEKHVLERASLCTTVCDRDTQAIVGPGLKAADSVRTVDIGIDFETLVPLSDAGCAKSSLLFVGSMDWQPNQDAVQWLLSNGIHDLLKRKRLHLVVAGRSIPERFLRTAPETVRFVANAADLRPLYASALAMVVPLRVAGGTRVKIREAMAYGVPVISTTIGAEGISYTDGKDILIADDVAAMLQAVDRVSDPAVRAGISCEALALVRREYDAAGIASQFAQFLRDQMQTVTP